jgi:hypothetical protein
MANKYANPQGKGFTPNKSAQSNPQTSPDIVSTATRTVVQAALSKSAAHLQQLEEGMEQVSEQFADRAVEIVKGGIQNCYSKASERIGAIVVEDFFAVGEVASMFDAVALPAPPVAVLAGAIDAA